MYILSTRSNYGSLMGRAVGVLPRGVLPRAQSSTGNKGSQTNNTSTNPTTGLNGTDTNSTSTDPTLGLGGTSANSTSTDPTLSGLSGTGTSSTSTISALSSSATVQTSTSAQLTLGGHLGQITSLLPGVAQTAAGLAALGTVLRPTGTAQIPGEAVATAGGINAPVTTQATKSSTGSKLLGKILKVRTGMSRERPRLWLLWGNFQIN